MNSPTIFYFGCWSPSKSGHYLYFPGGLNAERQLPIDFPIARYETLDGGLLPNRLPQLEGKATFVNINGWTIITFWDFSGDSRPGSNSSFVMRGVFTFGEACGLARHAFSEIWKRFKFEVVERRLDL